MSSVSQKRISLDTCHWTKGADSGDEEEQKDLLLTLKHSQGHSETSHLSLTKEMSLAPYKAFLASGKMPKFSILGKGGGSQVKHRFALREVMRHQEKRKPNHTSHAPSPPLSFRLEVFSVLILCG